MNKKHKKNLIEYGLFAVVVLGFYFSGLHTQVIGFAQRGLLATGIMNPDVEQIEENSNPNKLAATKADFNLHLMNSKGERVSMEQYRGKVIFINFWATWCPPCIAEMPSINKMYNNIDRDKIEVLMVSVDQKFEKAVKYRDKNNFNFEVYAPVAAIPAMYETNSIPTTYIINSKGELIFTHQGMADYNRQDFKDFLKEL
ncbi:TlpA family protein disulfide reductase [Aequorivita sp. F47161]|uniref:TlpA family protein disulfide reductase n=1 Tax=Aequorivita vitellina TaxID=2874475 RepID=A0A9X1QWT1_9FLAO|nr:TlpA disulfide reductase family protein [Aequorivita vitellina]MCG2420175.1 TlpA family protein disulfide reductase [Aequorivita vitellina]